MNLIEQIIPAWLDSNRLVKPQKSWNSSGNGLLYDCIFFVLTHELDKGYSDSMLDAFLYDGYSSCTYSKGCLKRSATSITQESWDDYMGLVVACLALGDRLIPKQVLEHGIFYAFFYDCDGKITFSDFLGRFPQLWVLYWPAAFPWLKWPLWPLLWLVGKTMKPDLSDTSSIQLQWLYFSGCKYLGFNFAQYDVLKKLLPDAFKIYYDPDHPFIEAAKELAQ